MLVPDLLRSAAEEAPERIGAAVDGGGEITYTQWESQSNALARGLVSRGIRPGDRVGLLFDNSAWIDNAVAYFGVLKAGGVAVPMSFRWSEREVAHALGHSEARGAIVQPAYLERVKATATDSLDWIETGPKELAGGHSTDSYQADRSEDDIADILYTSGTTGLPKGVASPHGNVANPRSGGMMPGAVFLHAIPLGTFAGTHVMIVLPVANRWTTVILPRFDAERYCAFAESRRATITYIVPSMAKLIVDAGAPARHDLSDLQMIWFGSAPMAPDILRRLHEAIPHATLVNLYGLTEAGGAGTAMTYDPARPTSLGRPHGEARMRVTDESGAECPPGAEGEIWLGLPPGLRSRSYYRDADASDRVFVEGWVRTGDIGYIDQDGYLYLVDRAKDIIIRGGYNIASAEVEGVLEGHPSIAEVAVVGVPHEVLGEDVAAVVVVHPGAEVTTEDIQEFCRSRLADYKIPRRIEFTDALPRNAFLKVLKRELRERLAQGN